MFYYADYSGELMRQQNKLVRDLEKAINGEYSAINCYAKLAEMAPTDKVRDRIREIRKDEKRHLQVFSQIYTNLTGSQPNPKQIEECSDSFVRGLENAMEDEQNTVDFYLNVADETSNHYVRDAFRRAAADEQNHAVWFLYFLTHARSRDNIQK